MSLLPWARCWISDRFHHHLQLLLLLLWLTTLPSLVIKVLAVQTLMTCLSFQRNGKIRKLEKGKLLRSTRLSMFRTASFSNTWSIWRRVYWSSWHVSMLEVKVLLWSFLMHNIDLIIFEIWNKKFRIIMHSLVIILIWNSGGRIRMLRLRKMIWTCTLWEKGWPRSNFSTLKQRRSFVRQKLNWPSKNRFWRRFALKF